MVIGIVDPEEKIQSFITEIEGMIGAGLVTVEKVQAIF